MTKEERQIEQISESIILSATVTCNKCHEHTEQSFVLDDYSAAKWFFEKGFRVTKANRIYCPTCAAKHLKH